MSSKAGSTTQRAEVKRVAVVTHGRPETSGEALEQLRAVAKERASSCCCRRGARQARRSGATTATRRRPTSRSCSAATGRCCGRCGASSALRRAGARRQPRAGGLPGLDRSRRARGGRRAARSPASTRSSSCPRWKQRRAEDGWLAVNDVVVTSSTLGRMIELGWAIGGEDLGSAALRRADLLDALRARPRTTSRTAAPCWCGGSTRWRSPSSRRTRCTRGRWSCRAGWTLTVTNRTPDVSATVLADGQQVHELAPGDQVEARLSEQRSLLATLPESTFFSRYRRTFVSIETAHNRHDPGTHACARGRYRP